MAENSDLIRFFVPVMRTTTSSEKLEFPTNYTALKTGAFGILILSFFTIAYLATGEISWKMITTEFTSPRVLLFFGTIAAVLIYGSYLLLSVNAYSLREHQLRKFYRFRSKEVYYDLSEISIWIPVSIVNGRVKVEPNGCDYIEMEFQNGASVKLTSDKYHNLEALLNYLKMQHPDRFIDRIAEA